MSIKHTKKKPDTNLDKEQAELSQLIMKSISPEVIKSLELVRALRKAPQDEPRAITTTMSEWACHA